MANAVTTTTSVAGYTTSFGNRAAGVKVIGWNTGDYIAGGLTIYRQSFGMRGFDCGFAGMSQGGHYIVVVQVATPGSATAKIRLFDPATGGEVSGALTADKVNVTMIGG